MLPDTLVADLRDQLGAARQGKVRGTGRLATRLGELEGLVLAGHHLRALKTQWAALDAALPVRCGVANSDVLRSYVGLLAQGKSDFDAIEGLRGDTFYKEAMGIGSVPSSPTLRQRLDAQSVAMFEHVPAMIERLLASQRPDYGVLECGWRVLELRVKYLL